MRAKDFLSEKELTPGELFNPNYLSWRPKAFLEKLKNGTPFVDRSGNQYFAKSGEYNRLESIVSKTLDELSKNPNAKLPSITIDIDKMITPDGKEEKDVGLMSISKFEKADIAKEKSTGQLRAINVQPIGIGIAANPYYSAGVKAKDKVPYTLQQAVQKAMDEKKSISASNMYKVIMDNKILDEAGEVGVAVKDVATQMHQGKEPDIRKYPAKVQETVAIDAGEYLGILALTTGVANFPKKEAFLKFLKESSFDNLNIIFPSEQNAQLGDSYGVQNPETGGTIVISSKGGRGKTATGAAPALSGLKQSIEKRRKRIKGGNALDFINSMIAVSPTTVQGFAGINWLNNHYKSSIPEKYENLLPFYSEDVKQILANIKTKGVEPIPEKFKPLIQSESIQGSKGTDGGKLVYVVTKDLVELINSGIIKDFRREVLELLEENFVQIFTRIVGGKLKFDVLWPAKMDGIVKLWTKISPGEPSKQGLSFKVLD